MPSRLLLQGPSAVGKTTLAERLVRRLADHGAAVGGVLTREARRADQRYGFTCHDLTNPQSYALIAHTDWTTGPSVGRYRIDLHALESIALPALQTPTEAGAVVVVDEIASMQLLSPPFVRAVLGLVDDRDVAVVATVHQRDHPVTDELLQRHDVEVVPVTLDNRDALLEHLVARLVQPG